jgi:hypothetical protein
MQPQQWRRQKWQRTRILLTTWIRLSFRKPSGDREGCASGQFRCYREIVVGGALVNDFEDLLQGGVSPLMPGRAMAVWLFHTFA